MSMRRIRPSLISLAVILVAPLFWSGQPAQAAADGCEPGFSTDFNGDGFSATPWWADPYATVGTVAEAGRVIVLYGDNDDRIGEGDRGMIFQGGASVGNVAETGTGSASRWPWPTSTVTRFTDLVVGSPYEDIGGRPTPGYVQIVWGAAPVSGPARLAGRST